MAKATQSQRATLLLAARYALLAADVLRELGAGVAVVDSVQQAGLTLTHFEQHGIKTPPDDIMPVIMPVVVVPELPVDLAAHADSLPPLKHDDPFAGTQYRATHPLPTTTEEAQ